jgi:hypothetical protein
MTDSARASAPSAAPASETTTLITATARSATTPRVQHFTSIGWLMLRVGPDGAGVSMLGSVSSSTSTSVALLRAPQANEIISQTSLRPSGAGTMYHHYLRNFQSECASQDPSERLATQALTRSPPSVSHTTSPSCSGSFRLAMLATLPAQVSGSVPSAAMSLKSAYTSFIVTSPDSVAE